MTEQEWLACTDPMLMLSHLRRRRHERKLRLFGCSSCRCVWKLLIDERSRRAVEASECFADGTISQRELDAAIAAASHSSDDLEDKCLATLPQRELQIVEDAWNAAEMAWKATVGHHEIYEIAHISLGFTVNVLNLLRDIFGNPFRPAAVDRRWLTSTVIDVSTAIYNERAFDHMPVLADALMEAGCDNEELTAHCRAERPHVRGCWAVDSILGKS
jgi:hypothetical protein